MTAVSAGSAFVDIQPRIGKGFAGALGGGLAGPMKAVGVGAAAVFATALGGGIAAFNIGATFDDAFDSIRVGTGATGEALEGLKEDFRAVASDTPAAFGDIGQAIADVNTRLGLTGKPLQDYTRNVLEAARITGGDFNAILESSTRVMGDWGRSVEDEGVETLDTLFRASQATGISMDTLQQQLVKYGAPLRQLGFGFDQSAALLGKFEKEGVNAELVMGSLRIALGKMAREGEPAEETLARVTDEIANAGSTSEANALALELFGARAGPDMAAAIREGRFELGTLFDTVAGGSETILGAADDTKDFAERWTEFKNRVLIAIEPLATRVFNAVGQVFETIGPKVEHFITQVLIPAFDAIGAWWAANGPAITAGVQAVFSAVATVIGTVVGAIQNVIGWFQQSREGAESSFGGIAAFAAETWPKVQEIISGVMEVIRTVIETVTDIVGAIWEQHGERIMAVVGAVWDNIKNVITTVIGVVKGIIETVLGLITGDWDRAWEGLKSIVGSVWEGIKNLIGNALTVVKNIIPIALDFLQEVWERVWDTIVGILGAVWDDIVEGVTTGIDNVKQFFVDLPGDILDWLGDMGSLLVDVGKDLVEGLWNGIVSLGGWLKDKIVAWVKDHIPGPIADILGISSPSKVAIEIGRNFARGIPIGLEGEMRSVERAASDLAGVLIPGPVTPAASTTAGASFGAAAGISVTTTGDAEVLAREILHRVTFAQAVAGRS